MGMFGFACGRCWERDCKCTPDEMEVYYKQAEINRNTPIQRKTPTLDGLRQQVKRSGLYRDWNAEPELNPDYKPDWDNNASKGRNFEKTGFDQEYCGIDGEPGHRIPDNIILAGTTGDDYEVLNKVNRNIKDAAVNKLPVSEDLSAALGPKDEDLTPQNKRWILLSLWFKPVGKYQWSHPALGDEVIWFDINTDLLVLLISRVFKEGYKNAHKEWASQQKQAT